MSIAISAFNSVATVLYRNNATGETLVWVCENPTTARAAVEHLKTLKHIEVLSAADSHVVTEKQAAEWVLNKRDTSGDPLSL